jgi:ThiF family
MSHRLIDRNADLKRLEDDGFEIEIIDDSQLVVRSVPYVNEKRQVRLGVLVSTLNLNGDLTNQPKPHTVMWAGTFPCDDNGQPLEKLRHGESKTKISDDLVTQFTFSNKPPNGYVDYHQLVATYVANISGPADVLDRDASPRPARVFENRDSDSVFVYPDTASSRAGIVAATRKLKLGSVAILGLGGSGGYVLDYIAKTPVKEIHLFDRDRFSSHNAFRAPGAASLEELRQRPSKVEYFTAVYSRMRRGVIPHEYHINASNVTELDNIEFVFICMDSPNAKRAVVEKLHERSIPFVDVGMGLKLGDDDSLRGVLRVTTSTKRKFDHIHGNQRISFVGDGNDLYAQNIQVAELNALNAALAVVKWKKIFGFYSDLRNENFSTYTIDGNSFISEDVI